MKRRPTFSEIVVLWKDEKRQYVKQSTYAAYCFLLQNHLLPAFGSMRDITDAAVQQFVNCKLSAGLSQKSVKDMLVVVKMVLSFGSRKGLLPPRQIRTVFPMEGQRREIQVLSLHDQRLLMAHIKHNFSFLNLGILISLGTGLRIGEICALRWEDIDVRNGVLHVSRTLHRIYLVDGEEKTTGLIIDKPKTRHSDRVIPMSRDLMSIMRPLRHLVRDNFYVITNTPVPIEPQRYRLYFKKLLKELRLPPIRFHDLRHSFATRCIESKCDYKTVSALLGHANISTTLDLYVHPDMEQKKKVVEAVNKMLRCP